MAAGERRFSALGIALVALALGLVAAASGFLVTAMNESSRAGRLERSTAHVEAETRSARDRLRVLAADGAAAERLQVRLQADVGILNSIDDAPQSSYATAITSIDALITAANQLIDHHNTATAVVHAQLDPLLGDARTKVAQFEQQLTAFSAQRSEIESALAASGKR